MHNFFETFSIPPYNASFTSEIMTFACPMKIHNYVINSDKSERKTVSIILSHFSPFNVCFEIISSHRLTVNDRHVREIVMFTRRYKLYRQAGDITRGFVVYWKY